MITKPLLPFLNEKLKPVTFGEFLKVARESLALTQAAMAMKITKAVCCVGSSIILCNW